MMGFVLCVASAVVGDKMAKCFCQKRDLGLEPRPRLSTVVERYCLDEEQGGGTLQLQMVPFPDTSKNRGRGHNERDSIAPNVVTNANGVERP